jgi:N-acetylneuraminate synthase
MLKVKIGNHYVSESDPTYLIAEIGINHNGSLEQALNLIDNSKAAGFNAVKFQKRTVDVVYSADELSQPRESIYGKTNGDLKRGLEFSYEQYKVIDDHCKKIGIDWFASPWDVASVFFLEQFDVVAHKIASASLSDKDLLSAIRKTNKPAILSTGMSTIEQIKLAINYLDVSKLILLHAVSAYPVREENLNLKAIATLRESFPNLPVGYSGHEVGVMPSIVAVAKYGALVVERHVTLDRSMWGSDQSASLELPGMVKLVRDIREIPKMLGDGNKSQIQSIEEPALKKLRRVNNL